MPRIGDYCSIGPSVVIGYGDHPLQVWFQHIRLYLNDLLFDVNETASILISHFNKVKIYEWHLDLRANVY
jgi:hypothetical protein